MRWHRQPREEHSPKLQALPPHRQAHQALLDRFDEQAELYGELDLAVLHPPTFDLGADGSVDLVLNLRNTHGMIRAGAAEEEALLQTQAQMAVRLPYWQSELPLRTRPTARESRRQIATLLGSARIPKKAPTLLHKMQTQ